MGTKTISIMDDAYKLLASKKIGEESFSDLIRRSFTKDRDIMKFAGSWKNVSDDRIKEIKDSIKELRKRSTKELLKNDVLRL